MSMDAGSQPPSRGAYADERYDNAIAVVGLAGRFPGAPDLEAYWRNLRGGVESISFFQDGELDGVDPVERQAPSFVKAKAIIDDAECFDAEFFGISGLEARVMDPQHRVFLECAWQAIEHAGYGAGFGTRPVGIFGGASINSYLLVHVAANPDVVNTVGQFQTMLGNSPDHLVSRVAYKLDLHGPSVTVQTACSTSLTAIHLACQSLLNHECDMALAGGVAISCPLKNGYTYTEGMIQSPDGHCRAFDAAARGTVNGNGVGIVVLRRLADALLDRDTVHAIVRGSAIGNDGASKVGYTAPSVDAQARTVREAIAVARVDPSTITYVEAHGSGTPLGDPVEIEALAQAFGGRRWPSPFCAVGSVKTNIGHLDAAAGVASFIKAVLALQQGELPPSLHVDRPNPRIPFEGSPFYVSRSLAAWPSPDGPRRAGVNSLGIGGTNVHVVLEEPPAPSPSDEDGSQLIVLSARTATALESATDRLAAHLERHPEQSMADVASTLQIGRAAMRHRRVVVCADRADAVAALRTRDPRRMITTEVDDGATSRPRIVFLFPGPGEHDTFVGHAYYQRRPVFARALDRCATLLLPKIGRDIRELLFPPRQPSRPIVGGPGADWLQTLRLRSDATNDRETPFDATPLLHPVLFALEYALAQLWIDWGIEPTVLVGYSIGEYVAACLAGVFSLEDALDLVATRARLIEGLPPGAMLAVALSEADARDRCGADVVVAASNAPSFSVLSGRVEAIAAIEQRLTRDGISARRLSVRHAFHSPQMAPIEARLRDIVIRARPRPPSIAMVSTLTGRWATAADLEDPEYWVRHLSRPVRFGEAMSALSTASGDVLIEVGPGRSLGAFALQHAAAPARTIALASLGSAYDGQDDEAVGAHALGRLWAAGIQPRWSHVAAPHRRSRVALPTYPFTRTRCWLEPTRRDDRAAGPSSEAGRKDLSEWFYRPTWIEAPPPVTPDPRPIRDDVDGWIVFSGASGPPAELLNRLAPRLKRIVVVDAGSRFERSGVDRFVVDPTSPEHYERLVGTLRREGMKAPAVVHLWNLGVDRDPNGHARARFDRAQRRGLYSILALVKALAAHYAGQSIDVWVVSARTQVIESRDRFRPERATHVAACKVAAQEYPGIRCRTVDVRPETAGWADAAARLLSVDIAAPGPALERAYRGERRWVKTYQPIAIGPSPVEVGLVPRGVYLITGGLGRIGLALAHHLGRTASARLVLVNRTALPPRDRWSHVPAQDPLADRISAILELERNGAEVMVATADVADERAMHDVLVRVEERFGPLNGVIHAAGVPANALLRPIAETAPSDCQEHFRPKVDGLFALHRLLARRPLDFIVLTSSLSPILGGLGFAAYAAANAFMDAFAIRQRLRGDRRWISVNWADWRGEADATGQLGATVAAYAISNDEGIETFRRVLTVVRSMPQVIVSSGELDARLRQWVEAAPEVAPRPASAARPRIATPFVEPATPAERRVAAIWAETLGADPIGVHDNFFELGGHSLIGIQIVSKLRRAFQIDLPVTLLLASPTVAATAQAIEQLLTERLAAMTDEEVAQLTVD